MKFKLQNATEFGWEGLCGKAYNSANEFASASAAYFEVTGSHGKVKTTHSDRVYLVLDGVGEFVINDTHHQVEKDDVIIVPKNTPYDYQALNNTTLKLFLVHTPAFDPNKEVDF